MVVRALTSFTVVLPILPLTTYFSKSVACEVAFGARLSGFDAWTCNLCYPTHAAFCSQILLNNQAILDAVEHAHP